MDNSAFLENKSPFFVPGNGPGEERTTRGMEGVLGLTSDDLDVESRVSPFPYSSGTASRGGKYGLGERKKEHRCASQPCLPGRCPFSCGVWCHSHDQRHETLAWAPRRGKRWRVWGTYQRRGLMGWFSYIRVLFSWGLYRIRAGKRDGVRIRLGFMEHGGTR